MAVILCADALSTYILTVMAVIKKAGWMLLVIAAAYNLFFLLATIKYDRTRRPIPEYQFKPLKARKPG